VGWGGWVAAFVAVWAAVAVPFVLAKMASRKKLGEMYGEAHLQPHHHNESELVEVGTCAPQPLSTPSLPPSSLRMRTLTPLTSATCTSRAYVDSLSQLTPNQSWAGVMCACACACVRTCRNGTDTDCRSSTQHNLSHFWSLIWKGQSGACFPCIQAISLPDNSHTHLLH
jgi:hypothetical protein